MITIKETTQEQGTCIGCGLCTAVCPENAISMHWSEKQSWVPQIDMAKCTGCNLCTKVCPNTPKMICKYAINAAKEGERFGLQNDAQYFIAYDLNPKNRIRSTSGGAVNAILRHLLETGRIDGVITSVPIMAPIGRPHYELKIVESVEELDNARSSHYYPLKYDEVLKEVHQGKGQYAITGTPCIMRGIKNLPQGISDRIQYTFCLVCSHNVTGQFLDCLAKQEGVRGGEAFVSNLRDKFGGIPDANNFNNYFKLSDREIRHNRFQTAFTDMWRNYFFAQECCLYCPDFYGVDADLSAKDAWGHLSSDPLGISLLIVRNPELIAALQEMRKCQKLFLESCDVDEVSQSQSGTAYFKHVEVRDRLVWKSAIRRELKNNPALSISRLQWKKSSLEYWQFRMMMSLSSFFYAHGGSVPVHKIIKASHLIVSLAALVWAKLLTFAKMLKGFISPVTYTILAFFKHPLTISPKFDKSDKMQVLIAGGYGYQNTGDEAQLATTISHWKQSYPNVRLVILSPNPEYTEKAHSEHSEMAPRATLFNANRNGDYATSNFWFRWRFRWIKPRMLFLASLYRKRLPLIGAYPHEVHLLNLIASASVLHLSGGGYLTGMTLSRLWDNMLLIRIADLLDTPAILSGQTVGVFKDRTSKRLARWGLNKAKLIYLRDAEGSIADIHSLGIKGTHIKATFDDALFCDTADKKTIDECLQKNKVDAGLPYIAVNVHYFKQEPIESRRIMKRIAEVCDYVASKHNAQIVFIPLHPSDSAAMEETQRNITAESKIVDYNFDYRIAKGIISRADICLTMKHHGIIFAVGVAVPTIAIALDDYYIRKNSGALKLFNQERWLVNQESLFLPGFMEEMVDDCFNKIQEQKTIISSRLREMRKQDGETIQRFLKDYLKQYTPANLNNDSVRIQIPVGKY